MSKVFCGTPANTSTNSVGDPVLGSPADGISGDYPIVTFAADHQLPVSDLPNEKPQTRAKKSALEELGDTPDRRRFPKGYFRGM